MLHLRPDDYRVMPWKNGGGSTTEIAIHPGGSNISGTGFIWRVSIAEVATNGPFSRFAGIDRHIMTIAGNGIVLDVQNHSAIDLSQRYMPCEFSGDWNVEGRLIDGPVRDFNLMVARARANGSLTVDLVTSRKRYATDGHALLLHVLEGDATAEARVIAEGDTLILTGSETATVTPANDGLRMAVVRVRAL